MQVRKVGDTEHLFVETGGFSTRHKPGWKGKWLVFSRR
jgi:hypothetical protein